MAKVPESRYEFQKAFAQLLKKPIGYVLGRTKGWPEGWFYECYSDVKYERDREKMKIRLMWWLREARVMNSPKLDSDNN